MPVDRPQLAVFVCPLVPDSHAVLLQVTHVGITLKEPQQFVDDRFQMQLLGSEQGKPFLKIEPHLMAEDAKCSRTRTVFLARPLVDDAVEQV